MKSMRKTKFRNIPVIINGHSIDYAPTNFYAFWQGENAIGKTFPKDIRYHYNTQEGNTERARRAVWTTFFGLPANRYRKNNLKQKLIDYLPRVPIPSSRRYTRDLQKIRDDQTRYALYLLNLNLHNE